MHRRLVVFVLVCLIIVPAASAMASGIYLYEMATPDVGTASAGMEARAGDASTAFTNPAGMTRIDGNQVMFGVQPIIITTKFSPGSKTTTSGTSGGDAGGLTPAGGLYAVYSLSDRFKLGMTVNSYAGLGVDYDDDWVGRYYVQEAALLTLNMSPSAALKVTNWLSVGAGLNVLYGKLKDKVAINNALPSYGDGQLELNDDAWGVGGSAGLLIEPTKTLRIGITYLSPVNLDFSPSTDFSGLAPGLKRILKERGLLNANLDLGITLPQQVMVGFDWQATQQLNLLASVGWQNWSAFSQPNVELDALTSDSLTVDLDMYDTFHVALGGRYAFNDKWRASLGASYDSSPVSDGNRGPTLPFDETWRFGSGVMYKPTDNLDLGLSYEFLYLGKGKIDKTGGALTGTLQGDYGTNVGNVVSLSAAWSF